MVLNQGEKKTVGGEQTEESLPQSKALGGSAPLQGVALLQTISRVSREELSRTPILLTSAIPGHCDCRPSSEQRDLYAHTVTTGMGHELEEIYQ